MSFNPLTGISSILTNMNLIVTQSFWYEFQSPDGDFVYSDEEYDQRYGPLELSFNPLTGISSILTGRRST